MLVLYLHRKSGLNIKLHKKDTLSSGIYTLASPFIQSDRSDQSVLIKMERMSSQNWFWPEWPCSWIRAAQFSCSGRPKRGNLESSGGKNVRARLYAFKLARISSFRPERTDGKQYSSYVVNPF